MYPWHLNGHRVFQGVLIAQFFMTLAISFFTNTWLSGVLFGVLILGAPLVMIRVLPALAVTRHVSVIATQLFAALHIQQTGGLTFMHFEIFAVMAVITVYRDWRVVISSVLVVAIHHVSFFLLQTSGAGVYIFEATYLLFHVLMIHAAFAIAEGLVLYFISKQSEKEAMAALEISDAISTIMADPGKLNLNVNLNGNSKSIKQFRTLLGAFTSLSKSTIIAASNISEVSKTVFQLSQEVEEASSSATGQVNTIAAATEQMTVNNASVSERAVNVNSLSEESRSSSEEARKVVIRSNEEILSLQQSLSATANTINSLSEKCLQIEAVMASITSISDQTNLLALNAAIESARAGEHGRGFAVVADEVRQLAMRTKENTQQISDITSSLIAESKASVNSVNGCVESSKNVAESSESAKEIIGSVVEKIRELSADMASVSLAITEQSQASEEIARSTNSLSITSNSLTTNAENSAQAVDRLNIEVNSLETELRRFA